MPAAPPPRPAAAAAAAAAPPPQGAGGALIDLIRAGVLTPGRGVLKVTWWGVELPPSADLLPDGTIQLPDGVGEPGVAYTPSSLLAFLAKHNRLFGFTKGNGWQAVSYNGKRLQELRGGGRV